MTDRPEDPSKDRSCRNIKRFLEAVREACAIEPALRNDIQVDAIYDMVQDCSICATLTPMQQISLCKTMTLETFMPRDVIFSIGDEGDKYYIIISGQVGVQLPNPAAPCPQQIHKMVAECTCPGRPVLTVAHLERPAGFGDLALQSNAPRSATIVATEASELLVITRLDFQQNAGSFHRNFIEERVKFLRKCNGIEQALRSGRVSVSDIAAMAGCLNEAEFRGNALLCCQGQEAEQIIFVRSGNVVMFRAVDCGKSAANLQSGTCQSEEKVSTELEIDHLLKDMKRRASIQKLQKIKRPEELLAAAPYLAQNLRRESQQQSSLALVSRELIADIAPSRNPRQQKRILRVGSLGPFQYFGFKQLRQDLLMPVSLVSDPVAEVYTISKHEVMRRLPKKMYPALCAEVYFTSTDAQLLQQLRQVQRWDTFCQNSQTRAREDRHQQLLVPRALAASANHADIITNLEFLGVTSPEEYVKSSGLTSPKKGTLSQQEQQFFSDAPAKHLRRFEAMRRDPGLREALARAGRERSAASEPRGWDGQAFQLQQHWSTLSNDIFAIDLNDDFERRAELFGTARSKSKDSVRSRDSSPRQSGVDLRPAPPAEVKAYGTRRMQHVQHVQHCLGRNAAKLNLPSVEGATKSSPAVQPHSARVHRQAVDARGRLLPADWRNQGSDLEVEPPMLASWTSIKGSPRDQKKVFLPRLI